MREVRPFESEHQDEGPREFALLTRREREVYRMLELAKSNKEIASQLGIAERTAKFHVGNILRKLGFSSRIDILAKNWPQGQ